MALESIALELSREGETDFVIERFSGATLEVMQAVFQGPCTKPHGANGAKSLLIAEAKPLFASVLAAVDHFFHIWDELCAVGREGKIDEVHEFRDRYLASFKSKMRLLDMATHIAEGWGLVAGEAAAEAATLQGTRKKLADFHGRVFERWQSIDDLGDMIAETFSLSGDKLRVLASRFPPPQSWYDEVSKPF